MLKRGARSLLLTMQKRRWHPPAKNYDPQFGDYPKLPWISFDQRNPNQHWDDPVHRRMFGETIPEEYDLQDAYFQGDHDPVKNLWAGAMGQVAVFSIAIGFLALGYLTLDPDTKPASREIPQSVDEHMKTFGWDRVNKRPYEPILTPPNYECAVADCGKFVREEEEASHH